MVNTHGKQRSTPPSRRRYEASHPTVSFRVDRTLYLELKRLKEQANLTVADVLKVGLERCEPLVGEAHHTGFMGGLAESYAVACDDCQDQVMAIAQADYSAAPNYSYGHRGIGLNPDVTFKAKRYIWFADKVRCIDGHQEVDDAEH